MTTGENPSLATLDVDIRMRAHAGAHADAPALSDGVTRLTWRELDLRLNRIANALIATGLQPNDTIALLGRNSLSYAEIMLGALRAGCCVAPLSTLSTHPVCATMVADSGARMLFAAADDIDAMARLLSAMPALLPNGLRLIGGDPADARSLDAFIRHAPTHSPDVHPAPQWGFNLIYSSGTTGTPKGILQSRAYRALESQNVIDTAGLAAGSRTIVSTPLYSNTTLFVLFAILAAGGSAVSCILVAQDHPDKLDTVGRPAPGSDLKILGEDGSELPPGKAGEIVGRSPTMMAGYHGREAATREASWFDSQGRRYQRSGDIGYFDTAGFLHLLDRKKDVIISGGFNIYATDLETVLLGHPDVADAAVVGMASPVWGETPAAFLVLRRADADPEAVRSWANQRLGKAQRIALARSIEALPRSPIGKILKRDLRDRLPPADIL